MGSRTRRCSGQTTPRRYHGQDHTRSLCVLDAPDLRDIGRFYSDVARRIPWSLAVNFCAVSCGDGKVTLWNAKREGRVGVYERHDGLNIDPCEGQQGLGTVLYYLKVFPVACV